MSSDEDIISKLYQLEDNFVSKLDLSKGYWQIPIEKYFRKFTAFTKTDRSFQLKQCRLVWLILGQPLIG